MDYQGKGLATHDIDNLLGNAIPVWQERRRLQTITAAKIRADRDDQLGTIIGGTQDQKARIWRAAEAKALAHDGAAKVWGDRIKTAEDDGLLLLSSDEPSFASEFGQLHRACHQAGRIRVGQREPAPVEMSIALPAGMRGGWTR